MSYTPIYTRKNFVNGSAPAINATNLNDIEDALVSLGNGLQTAAADTDTNTAAIATINGEISDLNDLIDEILPDDSTSGNPAVITDAFAAECKSLVLTLKPIQSGGGTPSPDNVRPISGRTQSVVTRTGKNLLDLNTATSHGTSIVTVTDNSINIKSATTYAGASFLVSTPANTFTLSLDLTLNNASAISALAVLASDNTTVIANTGDITTNGNKKITFTTNENSFYVRIYCTRGVSPGDITCNNVQLEVGSNATAYEPYNGESITRTYGTTIYGGTDDVTGESATSAMAIIDLGSLTWTYRSDITPGLFASADLTDRKIGADLSPLCDIYDYGGVVSAASGMTTKPNNTFCFYYLANYTNVTVYVLNTAYSDAAAFKTAMSGHYLAYELATPALIPLAPQSLTLLKGDNVITTDADNVEVDYKADIALYIAKQLGGNMGNRGAKSAPAEEPADDTKEEEKTDDEIIEPVTKEAKK